jgi:riboflavin synthase
MFTGIVQGVGTLRGLNREKVEIELPDALASQIEPGGSVAVNGVCLTVRALVDGGFCSDVSRETVSRTTFGRLRLKARVNLELPVSPTGRLDGHLVLGHVDAVGGVQALYRDREGWGLIVSYPSAFRHFVVEKGSVAVDGISLTPYGLNGSTFRCAVIPETYERTALQDRRSGDPVNLEFDVVAKYVEGMVTRVYHDR